MDAETELKEFLRTVGLPPKSLRVVRQRERSTVWSGLLSGGMGDAALEIITYMLEGHPEHITDFEEDKVALTALASLGHAAAGEVVFDGRNEQIAVIVLAYGEEARIARAVRAVLLADPDEQASMWYHPQLDRILGGTWMARTGTGWTRSSLMAAERALRLHAATDRLRAALPSRLPDDVVPETLAVFKPERVVAILGDRPREVSPDELLDLPSMALAPPEYRRLAQYVALVAEPDTVDSPDVAAAASAELRGFAGILMSITASTHRDAAATFRRGLGCCLRPEFVTSSGRLIDLYFLTFGDELDAAVLARLQTEDVVNALEVVRIVAGVSGEPLAAALTTASEVYTGGALRPALADLVRQVAWDATGDPGNELLTVLGVELSRRG